MRVIRGGEKFSRELRNFDLYHPQKPPSSVFRVFGMDRSREERLTCYDGEYGGKRRKNQDSGIRGQSCLIGNCSRLPLVGCHLRAIGGPTFKAEERDDAYCATLSMQKMHWILLGCRAKTPIMIAKAPRNKRSKKNGKKRRERRWWKQSEVLWAETKEAEQKGKSRSMIA